MCEVVRKDLRKSSSGVSGEGVSVFFPANELCFVVSKVINYNRSRPDSCRQQWADCRARKVSVTSSTVLDCTFSNELWVIPFVSNARHEELLAKGGLYADMWMQQQQAQDTDSASDSESKDRKSEKLQPPSSSSGHHGRWMYFSPLF